MDNIIFRPVKRKDLDEVFPLLQQLTVINYSSRDKDECWNKFITNNSSNSIVGVYNDKIIAYGSIIIEHKIRGAIAGHIEDIVVDKSVRGKSIGIKLIEELVKIGSSNNCYRITLTCKQNLINFYEKNNFEIEHIAMKLRL